ncbi:hypothetical protein PVAND_004626 [Polypedilum vanderplanki]|uniref:Uncharacterized protein n=1 Tax=Polypedilum vanderplanki TaxID=319348 RepID=A0A9J6BXI6_POLVA|nr:hypothetical protein PVAND_004626 [Polypedilum vanderplanki]
MPVQKTASNKVLYAFRGFIAFVAFIDLGTALRNYVERRSFMSGNEELTDVKLIEADFTICRIMGIYSILKAITLIQTTLYIHDKACVVTGSLMLVVNMIFSITECLYFRSSTMNFYVVFPFILNSITLSGLYYLPKKMRLWEPLPDCEDENSELLKKIGNMKKRRLQNKQKNN